MLKSVLAILALVGIVTIVACAGSNTATKPTTLTDGGTVQVAPDNQAAESQPSK